MHPDDRTSAKCNYCTHRVDIGLEPACVNVCPEHAIISGDMDNPETEISKLLARETVSVRKPEKGTKPKLFYIDGDRASLDPTATNPGTDYMWSSQSSGVGHFAKFAEKRIAEKQVSALVQIESREKKARRVYDAPNKGVLWGWEVSAYILTKAIAAGAFLVPIVSGHFVDVDPRLKQIGAIIALVFLAITGVLLIMDLGRPDRFLNVLLRPQWRSWLTRGAYIITGYGWLLTVWLIASFADYPNILKYVEPPAIVLALLSAVYTAFLFSQAKGRDFWQSPMLGVHMLVHSIMAGASVFLLTGLVRPLGGGFSRFIWYVTVGSLVFHLVTLAIELTTTHTTDDAHAVAAMILDGEFSSKFWYGMILVGNLLPLMFLLLGPDTAAAPAGFLILIGLWFAEHIWVKAPQRISLS
jgi:formate-dependent nitrite reductase membrane component NrfD